MEELLLVTPDANWKAQAEAYKKSHLDHGEKVMHGSAFYHEMPYDEWLVSLRKRKEEQPNRVPSSTFFCVRGSDSKIIGMLDIRHHLNEQLKQYGGHIGFGVCPCERQKGYAAQILKKALLYSKSLGLGRVMLTCDEDNLATKKAITGCGGVLEREFVHTDGKTVDVFWVET